MTTAGKSLLTLRSFELTPMVKRTVGNPELAGNLGQRFGAGFHQLNRFQFELLRKRSLSSCAWSFPFVENVHFFKFTFSTFPGQDHQQATCPEGHTSSSWTPALDNRTNEVIKIKFSTKDCQACPSLRLCTQSIRHVRRTVTIRPKEQYDALQARRQQETTKDFKKLYAIRAGVEGTISQGVRAMGLRRSRYIGQERTHLQHVATAATINIVRLMRWLNGQPHVKTRQSPLVQLLRPAA
jgi:hypothetical protein